MEQMIKVEHLTKHFKVRRHHRGRFAALRNFFTREHNLVRAVDQVSFTIKKGELVGYLGPNGAGKSTTLKMLTGLLVPTSGGLIVNGFLPWQQRQEYVANIGAVFGQRTTLWWDLPVIESLELLQHIYRIPPQIYQRNLSDFRQILELDDFLDTPVRSLSLGQRMRADLCAALLHDPILLFLDEPTIGLDVVAKERIRKFIQYINQERSTTILLTTHDLSDVEKLCQRVIIIDKGKKIFDGALADIKTRYGGKRQLIVDLEEEMTAVNIEGAQVLDQADRRITYQFERGEISASELIGRLSEIYRIRDLEVREPEIEETIRRIYENKLLSL